MEKGEAIENLAFLNLCIEIHKSMKNSGNVHFSKYVLNRLLLRFVPSVIAILSVYNILNIKKGN